MTSCSSETNVDQDSIREQSIQIVCSVGMITDMTEKIAGEDAEVIGLLGEGVDPHLYKPTRDDIQQLLEADIVFYVGLMLEGRMTDAFVQVGRSGTPVYPVTETLSKDFLMEPEGFEGHWDPHVWMDVNAWAECAKWISVCLQKHDPIHAAGYQSRTAMYVEQLKQLDQYLHFLVSTIPEQSRYLVTAHDAFGYFAEAYGMKVKAVQGISTESEAGIADVNELVDFIVTNELPSIFVESTIADKNLRAVIEGAAARGHQVTIGGELFSDAMGEPGTYEGTYIGMVEHNVATITKALGGSVPLGGFSDWKKNE
ncbi:MAG: zinc ABC transporter substrate-binding protein [Verrucomicrobiota bacterium]